jgi:hypothetical protein
MLAMEPWVVSTEHLFDTGGMPTGRRKPDPDRILCARLSGTATRLARAGGPIDEAVAELRALAAGRGDLLAEQAGIAVGAWSVVPEPRTRSRTAGAGRRRPRPDRPLDRGRS